MDLMEKIVSLSKRRGFVFPGSDIYGGLSNSWDYGPVGTELKRNIKNLWWSTYVHKRDDIIGLDAALIMNPKVWEASGHVEGFSDPLRECKVCHKRFRGDAWAEIQKHLPKSVTGNLDPSVLVFICKDGQPHKEENLTEQKNFNLMFKTHIGPMEDTSSIAYLRPETAQAMFVNFQNVLKSQHKKLPFGIAQMGKAFRNEITTGNFLFRLREFEQMEIEYFIPAPKSDDQWQSQFEKWRKEIWLWFDLVGIDKTKIHEHEIPDGERAHYSKRTIDFEFDYPFGLKELYGLAYRTNYDLNQHQKHSGIDLTYTDPETGEKFIPHVIEPTWGVDRTVLSILLSSYYEDEKRIVLKLKPTLAPFKAAVFPLVANKEELVNKAKSVYDSLKNNFMIAWDARGNIGKRYLSQDEIGTPMCITIDYDTLKDDTVTIRDRDTTKQVREKVSNLVNYINKQLEDNL